MGTSILYSDTPENFYQQLRECVQQAVRQEIGAIKKEDTDNVYIKKEEVCKMLQVSKPTVDSHVENGYYTKHFIGSRVFFNKKEILTYLQRNNKTK